MVETSRRKGLSGLAVIVLSLLAERPLHSYRIHQLIKDRGKDQVVNAAQRNSVQQTINRLQRDGLIEVQEVQQVAGYPQRTVYTINADGRHRFTEHLKQMLAQPAGEYPTFPAALSMLGFTAPAEAVRLLRSRCGYYEHQIQELRATLDASSDLPRILIIEDEYRLRAIQHEMHWTESLINDIESGTLTWDANGLIAFGDHMEDIAAPTTRP
ncbi:PadR family transcriptional regulator [Arthrobacter castelli]|uniref:PadR family transcriptional regulator n=1 Tax=Arthrobacter castelli TaxID=271431 RepID=UPI0004002E1A|nr:helix-turn-helix transcriptional regulator [Arthrobacter castelli]